MIQRYLEPDVSQVLNEKMVFISGPRQVGKTTFAKQIGETLFKQSYQYLNWDYRKDRKLILDGAYRGTGKLVIFDEVHKFHGWKNHLKGEFDKHKDEFKILVTGSARLDIYRKGGDSLLGRYRRFRLHPFSVRELLRSKEVRRIQQPFQALDFPESDAQQKELFQLLLKFGGFPEVFLKQSEKYLRLWRDERVDRLMKDDIRDLEHVRNLSTLQILVDLLPDKVGSLFSLNSLRSDLEVNYRTIAHWTEVLERFYYHFRIYPFFSKRIRSLKKEPKLYLWDWSEVPEESRRFENMLASHLLKFCDFLRDSEGYKTELFYLRDKDQRELDFLVTVDHKPWFSVEAKLSSKETPRALRYFHIRLGIPFSYHVVAEEDVDFIQDQIRTISASKFLSALV